MKAMKARDTAGWTCPRLLYFLFFSLLYFSFFSILFFSFAIFSLLVCLLYTPSCHSLKLSFDSFFFFFFVLQLLLAETHVQCSMLNSFHLMYWLLLSLNV